MRLRTLIIVLTLLIGTCASILAYLHFNPDVETAWYFGGRLEKSADGTPFICQDGIAYVKINESGSAQLWAAQPDIKSADGKKHCAVRYYRSVVAINAIYPDSSNAVVMDTDEHCRYYGTLSKSESKPSGNAGFLERLGTKVWGVAGAPPLADWNLDIKFRKCDLTPGTTETSSGSVPLGSLIKPIQAGAQLILMD